MSQQINLLLPALRPRFDWLALPPVAAVTVLGIVLIGVAALFGAARSERLKAGEAEVKNQVQAARQQIQSLGQKLGARQGDTTLDRQIAATRQAVAQRQEVLDLIARGDITRGMAYSGLLQGFARQTIDGVWLLGFGFADKGIEMRGRLIDPALLPVYINRLNNEPAFAGRRFAALDMSGVEPHDEKHHDASGTASPPAPTRYTEFALRTELASGQEKTQ